MKMKPAIVEILSKIQPKFLSEGLILSYDVNRIISILWRAKYDSKLSVGENNRFKVRCDTTSCDFIGLFAIAQKAGWFPAQIYGIANKLPIKSDKFTKNNFNKFKESFDIIEFVFEPKYDVQITDIPKFMYHFTKKNILG